MDSTKYIGMDVHKETISIAVLNSAGKLVIESILETKAMTILQFVQRLRVTCTMVALTVIALGDPALGPAEPARAVKVTVLSTMLAGNPGRGIGEWGFAALLEVLEAVYRLRTLVGLTRKTALICAG